MACAPAEAVSPSASGSSRGKLEEWSNKGQHNSHDGLEATHEYGARRRRRRRHQHLLQRLAPRIPCPSSLNEVAANTIECWKLFMMEERKAELKDEVLKCCLPMPDDVPPRSQATKSGKVHVQVRIREAGQLT